MSETEIVWLIGVVVGFSLGYGLGHLRGQCVGIKWCFWLDQQSARIEAISNASGNQGGK